MKLSLLLLISSDVINFILFHLTCVAIHFVPSTKKEKVYPYDNENMSNLQNPKYK